MNSGLFYNIKNTKAKMSRADPVRREHGHLLKFRPTLAFHSDKERASTASITMSDASDYAALSTGFTSFSHFLIGQNSF